MTTEDVVIRSEFAYVRVRLDLLNDSPRLRIEDVRTGKVGFLDALELESLAWCKHEDLEVILNPSRQRWRGESDD